MKLMILSFPVLAVVVQHLTWNFPRPYGMGYGSYVLTVTYWTIHFVIVLSPIWVATLVGWYFSRRGKVDALLTATSPSILISSLVGRSVDENWTISVR